MSDRSSNHEESIISDSGCQEINQFFGNHQYFQGGMDSYFTFGSNDHGTNLHAINQNDVSLVEREEIFEPPASNMGSEQQYEPILPSQNEDNPLSEIPNFTQREFDNDNQQSRIEEDYNFQYNQTLLTTNANNGNQLNDESMISKIKIIRKPEVQPQPQNDSQPLSVTKNKICQTKNHLNPFYVTIKEQLQYNPLYKDKQMLEWIQKMGKNLDNTDLMFLDKRFRKVLSHFFRHPLASIQQRKCRTKIKGSMIKKWKELRQRFIHINKLNSNYTQVDESLRYAFDSFAHAIE